MLKLPPFGARQRIGLFGGSFNPAHRGHRAVALYAMKRLKLDWVWWMVSPQNPLKDKKETGDYAERLAYTKRIANHPRFVVTDLEQQLKSTYTADTLRKLRNTMKHAHLVWIMGADSLANMHRWHDWLDIIENVPLAILARPGYSIRALGGRTATRLKASRLPFDKAATLADTPAPAWCFVSMPLRKESSTAIRKRRRASGLKTKSRKPK
jgi:nicotinate-nucleotide adenylyltransferase